MKPINPIALLSLSFLLLAYTEGAVPTEATDVDPIDVGEPIPHVQLQDTEGETIELHELSRNQPMAIIFYRGGWCPYCNALLSELVDLEPRLSKMGFQILALSLDRPEQIAQTKAESTFDYSIYSDSSMQAAKAFGVAFQVDEQTYANLQNHGIDLKETSGESHHMLPVPAVFLINTSGTITFRYYNPDYRERISTEMLLKAAQDTE